MPSPAMGVIEQEVEDGLLLLRDTGEYVIVNATGAFIWKLLFSAPNFEELVNRLASAPDAPAHDVCREQALHFIQQLRDAGFLRETD